MKMFEQCLFKNKQNKAFMKVFHRKDWPSLLYWSVVKHDISEV